MIADDLTCGESKPTALIGEVVLNATARTTTIGRQAPSSTDLRVEWALDLSHYIVFGLREVQTYYLAHPDESKTIESVVISEKNAKKYTTTEGLMWLIHALHFTYVGLQNSLANQDEELSGGFADVYHVTLRLYHNFFIKARLL
ncbi:hypothetical protein FRB98_001005 [Tulasnella sp. 332]|nr:hypothetical protein FRB98_001005 [Tulasnella sp. 332]